MNRRAAMGRLVALTTLPLWVAGCGRGSDALAMSSASNPGAQPAAGTTQWRGSPLLKTDEEWRAILPADRYRILIKDGTEPPRSSPLNDEKREGTYVCAACFLPLFDSAHKFESGTGWPSFFDHLPGALETKRDFRLIWPRTEYHCARCSGHQGHVFDDGPQPTGKRWCNNGLALEFVPRDEPMPALRT